MEGGGWLLCFVLFFALFSTKLSKLDLNIGRTQLNGYALQTSNEQHTKFHAHSLQIL